MEHFYKKIEQWISENRLVQIIAVFEKLDRKLIIGRIIQLNRLEGGLLIYTEDDKKVENLLINEIDDIFII
jgi:hypothetical protein